MEYISGGLFIDKTPRPRELAVLIDNSAADGGVRGSRCSVATCEPLSLDHTIGRLSIELRFQGEMNSDK